MENLIETDGKVDFIFFCRHMILSPPLAISGEEYNKLKNISKKFDWTIVSHSATPFDKWVSKYWKRLGAEIPTNSMLIVNNDYVIDVHISKKSREEWDNLVNSKTDFDIKSMTEVLLSEKSKMIVFITKDKELAATLKEY